MKFLEALNEMINGEYVTRQYKTYDNQYLFLLKNHNFIYRSINGMDIQVHTLSLCDIDAEDWIVLK